MIGAYGLHQDQGSCLGRYVRSQDMLKASEGSATSAFIPCWAFWIPRRVRTGLGAYAPAHTTRIHG